MASTAGGADLAPVSVAVVIATHDRAPLLRRTLDALRAQRRRPDEVVVVDDCSTDDTPAVLEAAVAAGDLPLRVIRLAANAGPAVARNAGWRDTRADVVAFTDDDCRPDPGWLERLVDGIGDADIVQGRIEPDPEQADRGRPFTRSLEAGGSPFFETANIAFRRDLLTALDGFDESYRFQGGEDTDLGQRALLAGAATAFVPEALVRHEVFPLTVAGAIRHARRCDQLIQAVVRHPTLHQHFRTRLLLLPHHPKTLGATAGAALALGALASRRPVPAALGAAAGLAAARPWLVLRLRRRPTVRSKPLRIATLPAQLAVELTEISVILRARARHRAAPAGLPRPGLRSPAP